MMPLLLDGNNLIHRLGSRSRRELRRRVLDACRAERMSVTVVFDGPPPPGSPARENLGAVTILYSGAATADDVIIGRLPDGGAARDWSVVTDDRGLARRARERGASVRTVAQWQRRSGPPAPPRPRETGLSPREISEWEKYFSRPPEGDDD